MKKFFAALAFSFLLVQASALEFRPSSVKEMDVNVLLSAEGSFSGEISSGDTLELKFLTLNDTETQEVIWINEKLLIGTEVIEATHEVEGPNKFAVFKVNDLQEFAGTPTFKIEVRARLKTRSSVELGEDFNISSGFEGMQSFLQETDYIEVNDKELESKTRLEFESDSELESIREIAEWVNQNIVYDFENYYNGTWSAKSTYNSRRGVCDEFANLTAAFTRIKGIPTRYVSGVSFDGKLFGNHGWLEVILGNSGWVGIDSTYGEAGYLDAAHFTLAKTLDANQSVNLQTTTVSRQPITVESTLHNPQVEVNGIKFFEDLVEVEIIKPERVGLNEEFEVKAVVKNRKAANIIIPVELLFHQDIQAENQSRLEWFKPLEEKTISWKAVTPAEGREGYFTKYGMIFLTPDKNISFSVEVFPEETEMEEKSRVSILDVSPFIKEGTLSIEVKLKNSGGKDGSAALRLSLKSRQLASETVSVEAGQTKTVVLEVQGVKPEKFLLSIESPELREFEIVVPEEKPGEVEISEKPVGIEVSGSNGGSAELENYLVIAGIVGVAFIAVIAGVFIFLAKRL